MNKAYQFKQVLKYLMIMAIIMFAMKMTGGSGFLLVVPLLFLPLAKGDAVNLFFYLLLTVAMLMGNHYLMPKNTVFGLAQRGMLVSLGGIMALRIFGQRNASALKPLLGMSAYLVVAVVSSLQGWNATISFLKIFLFTMIYFAYFGAANQVATANRPDVADGLRAVFLAVAIFFIAGSVALIPLPGIGQLSGEEYAEALKNGQEVNSLFKGMTMHSQSLGPIVVMLFVLLLGDLVFAVRQSDLLYITLLFLCPLLVFKTSSRTALGGLVFGLTVLLRYVMQSRGLRSGWKSKVLSTILFVSILGSVALLLVPSVRESATEFLLKTKNADARDLTFENVAMSRQGKWDEGIANFKKSPLFGNGFQVSEDMASFRAGLTILSAPVEKSVWISAILEETGVIGFLVFVVFALTVLIKGKKHRCYIGNAAFLTLLVSNLGEFTLFSMSYTGGFQWAMVFVGYALDAQRNRWGR